MRSAMPQAISNMGIRRQGKRETAMVPYNILDAQHSGDGVTLLASLRSYDAHLSVTFISGEHCIPNAVVMFVSYGATSTVPDILPLNIEFRSCNFFIGFMLHTKLFLKDCGIKRTRVELSSTGSIQYVHVCMRIF